MVMRGSIRVPFYVALGMWEFLMTAVSANVDYEK